MALKQKKKNNQAERSDQRILVKYLKTQYPNLLFASSANGAIRNVIQAQQYILDGLLPGMPDLQIIRACGGKHGLFIEMKREKKEGQRAGFVSQKQKDVIAALKRENYAATICYGFAEAKLVVDNYLMKKEVNHES